MAGKTSLKNRFDLNVGGQAIIEGVMMRCKNNVAIAVRKPNKKISIKKEKINSLTKRPFFSWPLVRGTIMLFETLVLGIKALNYSANESLDQEEEKITKAEMIATTTLAFLFAIGLFVILPLWLTKLTTTKGVIFNLIDGIIRIVVFLIYLYIISLMSEVKTLFQYHGAEHMAVNCFEAGKKVTVQNAKKYTTIHRRCGTTFLLIVLMVSIVVFSLIVTENFLIKLFGRIILLPVIAGISYELLKLGARYKNFAINALVAPGLWLQGLTTREPTDKQLGVACKALNAVVKS